MVTLAANMGNDAPGRRPKFEMKIVSNQGGPPGLQGIVVFATTRGFIIGVDRCGGGVHAASCITRSK